MLSKLSGLQIGSGPIRGGFFNNDGTAFTGPNPLLKPGLGPRDPNFYETTLYEGGRRPPSFFDPSNQGIATLGTLGGQQMIPEQGPLGPGLVGGERLPNGTGTQMPIGGTPISPSNNTSINSLFKNQEFDQYLNSYVDNLINQRMKQLFGGIMSIFQ